MRPHLCNDGCTKGQIGHEVAYKLSRESFVNWNCSYVNPPSMMSICNQSAPSSIVLEQAAPRAPKSADNIDGAMIVAGAILSLVVGVGVVFAGQQPPGTSRALRAGLMVGP